MLHVREVNILHPTGMENPSPHLNVSNWSVPPFMTSPEIDNFGDSSNVAHIFDDVRSPSTSQVRGVSKAIVVSLAVSMIILP